LFVAAATCLPPLPLSTKGRWVVDVHGNRVKFAGVNWYGFDSSDFAPGGLHVNSLKNIVDLISDWGFTAIRIPWSLELWQTNPVVSANVLRANPDLQGLHGLEILDRVIAALSAKDILIMLDNHVSNAEWCCSNTDGNGIWFSSQYPASSYYNDWRGIVARYKNVSNVVAVDVRNEVRCAGSTCPNWGKGDDLDWARAAEWIGNAIHEINPNLLIVVEGINYALDLTGVKNRKVTIPNKVVYSAHDYSWDTSISNCSDFQNKYLIPNWAYISQQNIAPVFLGEFGTCYTDASCVSSQSEWMECFTSFLKTNDLDWFYWALDGTQSSGSGRTFGAVESFGLTNLNWSAPAWPWFLQNKLQPMQKPA